MNDRPWVKMESYRVVFLTGPAPKSSKCWGWQIPYQKSESGAMWQRDVRFNSNFHFFGREFAILNT